MVDRPFQADCCTMGMRLENCKWRSGRTVKITYLVHLSMQKSQYRYLQRYILLPQLDLFSSNRKKQKQKKQYHDLFCPSIPLFSGKVLDITYLQLTNASNQANLNTMQPINVQKSLAKSCNCISVDDFQEVMRFYQKQNKVVLYFLQKGNSYF